MRKEKKYQFGIIGYRESERVLGFQNALEDLGFDRAFVLDYRDVLRSDKMIHDFLQKCDILKIESPDGPMEIEKRIVKLGLNTEAEKYTEKEIEKFNNLYDNITESIDLFVSPDHWFYGFESILKKINDIIHDYGEILLMNHPLEITQMFDKVKTNELLKESSISVPPIIPPFTTFENILELMEDIKLYEIFIKPRYGSSGSGIIALKKFGDFFTSYTTLFYGKSSYRSDYKLYNKKTIRNIRNFERLEQIINQLSSCTLYGEKWIPKVAYYNRIADLRVLMVNGKVSHSIIRLSNMPITNLHLDSFKIPIDLINQIIPVEMWEKIQKTCQKVMSLFPNTFYAGIDVIINSEKTQFYINEVNAFGDLLRNINYKKMDTYAYEIQEFTRDIGDN